jgi:hypothetical protein
MNGTIRGKAFVAACVASTLGGCGFYVSNIRFTSVEVCSEEYASRLHPNSGCLPPTRAENAQGFFLARYRLPISPDDAEVATGTKPLPAGTVNHLPSMIGRLFQAVDGSSDAKTHVWQAPPTGNIEFIAVGSDANPPHRAIATEILVKTDLAGVMQKKLTAGVELNPAKIVDAAFAAAGVPAAAALSGLREALVTQVIKVGYERYKFDAAKGDYYYVSMKPAALDSLMSAFAICNWSIDQDPGKQRANAREIARGALAAEALDPVPDCSGNLRGNASIAQTTKNLIEAIHAMSKTRADLKVAGVVIGAAILRTEGFSELCSKADIGLIAQGKAGSLSTLDCDQLRALVQQYRAGPIKPPAMPMQPGQNASTLSPEQANALIASVSAEYARATAKYLELQSHTSVLAIHWVPIRIAKD